jgi:hypothetical protein
MEAVFLYSRASVRAAFDTALDVAQATRGEALRRQRLDNLLQHMRDGVVALDSQGKVEAINRRLAAVLGIDAMDAVGRTLLELAPDIAAALPDADGDALGSVRGVSYVVHRGPLATNGAAAGTVLTFQESRAVERLDRTLRSKRFDAARPLARAALCEIDRYAADPRRKRHRQGDGRAEPASTERAARLRIRGDQLRRVPGSAAGKRTVRIRGGRFHRRAQGRQGRAHRSGTSRHALSR